MNSFKATNRGSTPRRRWALAGLGGVSLATLSFTGPASLLDDTSEDVAIARAMLEQWVETQRTIAREKSDWVLGREMLDSRIEVVQDKIQGLQGEIEEAEAEIEKTGDKREELLAEQAKLEDATASLGPTIEDLEARAFALLQRIPDPIREKVKPLSQQIPEVGSETELSLSTRFRNVIGVLNEVDKFNREITVDYEVRTLADGRSAEVSTIYIGLGQGYYVTGDQSAAGIGKATEDGWEWTSADEHAEAIANAIAVQKIEQEAVFVRLPLTIQ